MSAPRPEPFFFGSAERPLFGWLHRPAPGTAPRIGVVLCSPTGYEAIATHRTYRHFAEQAAAHGFPALRFDYDGTGNSAGHTLDSDRVAAWLESVRRAIEALEEFAQVEQVCLFGIRVGASLAAVAAQGRSDIHSMIAFAPVVKVKGYLREIRALALARPKPPPPPGVVVDPELQEAAGFVTSEATRTDLAKIDLLQLAASPAGKILIFDRDDLPGDENWPRRLAEQGAVVERLHVDGYVNMMRDAHESTVPHGSIEAAFDWLTLQQDLSPRPEPSPQAPTRHEPASFADLVIDNADSPSETIAAETHRGKIRETPVFLDGPHRLFGIISEPIDPTPDGGNAAPAATGRIRGRKSLPSIILLNSGTVHHIGPSRLYVNIARLCAARGIAVLRLDLSGVGESPPRAGEPENTAYSSSAPADIEQAVSFTAARFGADDVHLVGICSGAYHGLKAAVRGLPLRSVVVINPLTFFWKQGMSLDVPDFQVTSEVNRYRKTAFQLSAWIKLLRGHVDLRNAARIFYKRFQTKATHALREIARALHIPLHEDLAGELRTVERKKIGLLFVFSSTDPGLAMLHEQGGRSVRRLLKQDAMRIAVVQDADHTFTAQWNRDQLTGILLGHVDRQRTVS